MLPTTENFSYFIFFFSLLRMDLKQQWEIIRGKYIQVLGSFSKYSLTDKSYISDIDYKNITKEKLFAFLEKSLWGFASLKKNNNNKHLSDFWERRKGPLIQFWWMWRLLWLDSRIFSWEPLIFTESNRNGQHFSFWRERSRECSETHFFCFCFKWAGSLSCITLVSITSPFLLFLLSCVPVTWMDNVNLGQTSLKCFSNKRGWNQVSIQTDSQRCQSSPFFSKMEKLRSFHSIIVRNTALLPKAVSSPRTMTTSRGPGSVSRDFSAILCVVWVSRYCLFHLLWN